MVKSRQLGARTEMQPGRANALLKFAAKAPVHIYRWTLKPFLGANCRHLPSCSQYALEAIEINGAWRGFWLTTSRLCRCHRFGTAGIDPAPDLTNERHPMAPWRYGRWTGRHMVHHWVATGSNDGTPPAGR